VNRFLDFYRLQETDGLLLFWLKESLVAVLIFAAFWVAAKLLRYLLITWGPRFTSLTSAELSDRVLQRVIPPLSLVVVCAGLYYAIRSLQLPANVQLIGSGLVFILNIIILTNAAYRATDEFLKWYGLRFAQQDRGGVDRQLMPLLEKVISIFLIGTALIITLKHFNYDILSLVTALGIGSLAIGLAAKDTLANMISGFTLMIDRPFRIGDRVQLTGGQSGDVADIGLRSTKIKTGDNTLLIIPNSELCNSTLVNMSFPDVRTKVRINVGVSYRADIIAIKSLLTEIAMSVPGVEKEPQPESFLMSLGESSLNISLFFWVMDYTQAVPVTDRVNTEIINCFRERGIEIPYTTRTVLLEKENK